MVVAAGSPELVRGSWLKSGAVVIDVGFNVVVDPSSGESRICGDVAFEEAREASIDT